MTAKQPQAGEYWQKEYTRVCVVGTKKNGLTVGETECGNLISFMSIHDWQHLPECDSFKWQPEEFCSMCGVNPVIPGTAGCNDCTEFALDAVRAPVESPDNWVEITDPNHEPRDGVDWFNGGPSGQWIIHEPRHVRSTLKEYQQSWPMGRFRCRRKDLPPVPSPEETPTNQQLFEMIANLRDQMAAMAKPIEVKSQPKPVTVRLVCSTEDIGSVIWRMHDDPGIAGEAEIKHDGYKFYVEGQR